MSKSPEQWWTSGSHGFLGRQLVEQLKQSGQEPIKGNREGEVHPLWISYIVLAQAFGNYHWQTSVYETYKANVLPLARILQNGEMNKGIVYISSSSVLLPHQTHYSASKRAGEEMVTIATRNKKIPAVVVRPSSVTGVGEQKEHLIPKLIDSCLNGTEMEFVAEPTHDFVDVSDVARAIIFMAEHAKSLPGKIVNASSGVTTSNEEVLSLVEQSTHSKANLHRLGQLRDYDTKSWVVDNSGLRDLGWKPEVTLAQSIQRMVEHAKQ